MSHVLICVVWLGRNSGRLVELDLSVILDIKWDSRRPTECVSPNKPKGASALRWPRRIFSSFGNGGKNKGGGGCPGRLRSGILGGADVKALMLCAYARSSGYGMDAIN